MSTKPTIGSVARGGHDPSVPPSAGLRGRPKWGKTPVSAIHRLPGQLPEGLTPKPLGQARVAVVPLERVMRHVRPAA
jgi:hypothetical protein